MAEVVWSPRAKAQLEDIVLGIAQELSVEDGLRWEAKLKDATERLEMFPRSGKKVPRERFIVPPPYYARLRMLVVRPYVIVYDFVGAAQCNILSVRHGRMMLEIEAAE